VARRPRIPDSGDLPWRVQLFPGEGVPTHVVENTAAEDFRSLRTDELVTP